MKSAIKHLSNYYGVDTIDELYSFLKEEICASQQRYFPNPLQYTDCCVHIVNADHPNLPVHLEGTLDLIGDIELFSTCYPKKPEGIDW